jgi:hypothetical protein
MARVEAVPERKAGTSERLAYRFSRHRFGEVVDPLAVMAHTTPCSCWATAC